MMLVDVLLKVLQCNSSERRCLHKVPVSHREKKKRAVSDQCIIYSQADNSTDSSRLGPIEPRSHPPWMVSKDSTSRVIVLFVRVLQKICMFVVVLK